MHTRLTTEPAARDAAADPTRPRVYQVEPMMDAWAASIVMSQLERLQITIHTHGSSGGTLYDYWASDSDGRTFELLFGIGELRPYEPGGVLGDLFTGSVLRGERCWLDAKVSRLQDREEVAQDLRLLTDPIDKPTSTAIKKRLKDCGWSVFKTARDGADSVVVGRRGDRFAVLRGTKSMRGREPGVEWTPWFRRVEKGNHLSLLVHDRAACDAFLDEVLADRERWFPKTWLK